jgi:hypothetical protein
VRLDRVTKLQHLLDLLMQIRPYGVGMEQGLIVEAMDCVVIEISRSTARYAPASRSSSSASSARRRPPTPPLPRHGETVVEARKRRGAQGMRVLRKAAEQSMQLSSYFELCQGLGVRVPDRGGRKKISAKFH